MVLDAHRMQLLGHSSFLDGYGRLCPDGAGARVVVAHN
jgi:hypothetical protein